MSRELLESAAKAAGIRYIKPADSYTGGFGLQMCDEHGRPTMAWSPLADDGDALRLAVKLGINVMAGIARAPSGFTAIEYSESGYRDDNELTRLAIVRAAAAMHDAPNA